MVKSSTPTRFSGCAMFQFRGVKISVEGETMLSLSFVEVKVTVTVPFGGEESSKLVLLSVVPSRRDGVESDKINPVPKLLSSVVTVIVVLIPCIASVVSEDTNDRDTGVYWSPSNK